MASGVRQSGNSIISARYLGRINNDCIAARAGAAPPTGRARATAIDKMLNGLKSKHGLSLPVMVGIDAILSYLMENPEETFTPARQRIKDLTEESQKGAPKVLGTRRPSYAASYLVVHAGCAMRAHR